MRSTSPGDSPLEWVPRGNAGRPDVLIFASIVSPDCSRVKES
jgi:hypothetical protein